VGERTWGRAGLAAGAIVTGAWLIHGGVLGALPPAPVAAQAYDGTPVGPAVPPLPPSPPVRVRIPALGVDAPVSRLGLDAAGRLQPPPEADGNLAGWYLGGAAPGSSGTAVLAGHVDTAHGPAVFYRLGALRRGDQVEVARADRATAWFQVDGVEVYPKREFPDVKVYAPTPDAQLRLITCGGAYTREGGWDGNVVVYAHLVRTQRA